MAERKQAIFTLEEWAQFALAVLEQGVELMPLDQLRQWEGVRACIEFFPLDLSDTRIVTHVNIKTNCTECGEEFHILTQEPGQTVDEAVDAYFDRIDYDPEQHPYEVVKMHRVRLPEAPHVA